MTSDGFLEPAPAVTFADEIERLPFDRLLDVASDASPARVTRALATPPLDRTLDDFAALLSPAAAVRLEELAAASRALTIARFGKTMRMYAPLYLSNECLTTCAYCGFAKELPIARKTLSPDETLEEVRHLLRDGFRSILLLTGEHERLTGVEFLEERIRRLSVEVPQLAIEVQVWNEREYRRLVEAGCEGLVIYQETYHPETYARVHLGGRKRRYRWRLLGPERGARAGMRRLGIGALFGLHEDWRYEAVAVAAHSRFLQRHHWRAQLSVSVPRMRPSASGYRPTVLLDDRELAQLVCALRLTLPDAGLVLSTREASAVRDGLARIGITHMSAGSHTEPGGYEHPDEATEQFEIADERSPAEVAERLRAMGYDPVWEDWGRITPRVRAQLAGGAAGSAR
ncbi:MAG TPA: 2-iminoacetate synthase ThiH [Actinomycetota bacterium]|jgi:2-iminoacetate synthase|nr:2-iminoacetate synthase ThiH [Actinomycetota bacterium]